MNKYLKVMFENKGVDFEYKIGEVNIANNWNPNTYDPKEMGGFNFSTEDKILRWLIRGDTIYNVEVPIDAEIIDCPSESAPHGVFRSNKIILDFFIPLHHFDVYFSKYKLKLLGEITKTSEVYIYLGKNYSSNAYGETFYLKNLYHCFNLIFS